MTYLNLVSRTFCPIRCYVQHCVWVCHSVAVWDSENVHMCVCVFACHSMHVSVWAQVGAKGKSAEGAFKGWQAFINSKEKKYFAILILFHEKKNTCSWDRDEELYCYIRNFSSLIFNQERKSLDLTQDTYEDIRKGHFNTTRILEKDISGACESQHQPFVRLGSASFSNISEDTQLI